MSPRLVAYIGLGSNLAAPRIQIEKALQAMAQLPDSRVLAHSRLYRSSPWGFVEQPDFINAAAAIETGLTPAELMQSLLEIERGLGRERDGSRWGPRIIDLDLLLYGSTIIDEPGLRVPHPHLHQRAFVLLPLAEIAPQLIVPGRGSVAELLAGVDARGCRPLDSNPD
jgi:2-amino-4-hydroxy-6-hydroxymethyldihydropteridine diphosphokinase